ncbi:MAG: aminoacyl-tRNA hydrolase [Victivallales bacterium]|nr:aminoacyl-tRNA hydrolase [Victivallales bacterium]
MGSEPQDRIRLVVGLGNPGEAYVSTRHNAGFMVLERVLKRLRGKFVRSLRYGSDLWEGNCKGSRLLLARPLTYMNLSGGAVSRIASGAGLAPREVLVVYDDMDLPLGRIRIRKDGGAGGHRGVESVIAGLGSADFARVRVGIGRGECPDHSAHVLAGFADEKDKEVFVQVLETAADAVKLALYRGLDVAMNEYNGMRHDGKRD